MADEQWIRSCGRCLSTDLEEVGQGYWYCNGCGNIWEVVAPAKHFTQVDSFRKAGADNPKTPKPPITNAPEPGMLKPTDEVDFP